MTEAEHLEFVGVNEVRLRNRTLTYFSGCDYFRLARNPKVAQAARTSLAKDGLNVAASRRTTGNHGIYTQLEASLATFFGAEAALVFPDGYLAPIAAAQALAGQFTYAFVDELAHGALLDAARMLDCPVKKFKHRDPADLAKLIARCGHNVRTIILTDGMFSHDGSVAPLREYLKILPAGGMILVDDAHGVGVLGAKGRGTLEHENVSRRRIIQCATLSKALGVYGGMVLTSRAWRKKILERSRTFAGTTPLPPPLAGAALAALQILRSEPARRDRLFQNLNQVRRPLRQAGWEISETPGPIIRLPAMSRARVENLKKRLLAAGIYPPYLIYGASAQGIFRFVISSEHTREQLDRLIAMLTDVAARARC
ncbi:MAG TPA: pyridoxal phosphate-dependent aminotransferase family protein [Verrucomicrobiae bacterium]|nr:pyridoxal phosphate-dependent aminotransferase family protein [Verrucomicrobiae bacterium]